MIFEREARAVEAAAKLCVACGNATGEHGGKPCSAMVAAELQVRLSSLAIAMRALGIGRATVDGITLDLTCSPLPLPTARDTEPAPAPAKGAKATWEKRLKRLSPEALPAEQPDHLEEDV